MKVTKSGLVVAGAAIVLIASGFAYANDKDMKNENKEMMKQHDGKHEKHHKHDGKHEKHHKHEKHEKHEKHHEKHEKHHEKHHEKGDGMKKGDPNTQQQGTGMSNSSGSSSSGSSY